MKFYSVLAIVLLLSGKLLAQDSSAQRYNLHFQATYIYQYKPEFSAKYSGPHSISTAEEKQNSVTATMYVGAMLWKGAEVYVNPEIAGGSGLTGAFGMAGSTNGETFRVGNPSPTLYLARAYFKQTIALDKSRTKVEDGQNLLEGAEPGRYFRLYAGKFSLGDFFDNNPYANAPRTQFLNWALMNNTAWDYAANVRGYTVGGVAVLQWDKWSYKVGVGALPEVANGAKLNMKYGESRALNGEVSRAITIHKREGHVRVLGYVNTADMGSYKASMAHTWGVVAPDIITTEKIGATKVGFGINMDQAISDYTGIFARLGWNDGKTETWAFTEADRTLSLGLALNGNMWHRKNDNGGIALVANGLSKDHSNYLAAGGLGFQLGDGELNYRHEFIAEAYYSYKPTAAGIWISGDYQFAMNPGYNKDRGPLQVLSLRVHVEL